MTIEQLERAARDACCKLRWSEFYARYRFYIAALAGGDCENRETITLRLIRALIHGHHRPPSTPIVAEPSAVARDQEETL